MKPIGTFGIIIAIVLSLFAAVPNLVAAQTDNKPPAVSTTTTTTTPAGAAGTPATDGKPSTSAAGTAGPTYPPITLDVFRGPTKFLKLDSALLDAGSFAACVERQFGLRFQLLPAAAQAQILKEYARYAVPEDKCLLAETGPTPVSSSDYFWTLGIGSVLLIGVFCFAPPVKGFLNETIPLASAAALPPLDAAITQKAIDSLDSHFDAGKYSQKKYSEELNAILERAQGRAPLAYVSKFSVSRLIALLGTYVIVVTFAFATRYGFWALNYGDNTIFEKITSTILLGGVAAFTPYVVSRIAEAVKPAPK